MFFLLRMYTGYVFALDKVCSAQGPASVCVRACRSRACDSSDAITERLLRGGVVEHCCKALVRSIVVEHCHLPLA